VDLAGGRIPDDALGSTVQEIVELVRRELDENQEKRLCEATLEDLQREFEREQNRRRRQRLRRILDELRQRWDAAVVSSEACLVTASGGRKPPP